MYAYYKGLLFIISIEYHKLTHVFITGQLNEGFVVVVLSFVNIQQNDLALSKIFNKNSRVKN